MIISVPVQMAVWVLRAAGETGGASCVQVFVVDDHFQSWFWARPLMLPPKSSNHCQSSLGMA